MHLTSPGRPELFRPKTRDHRLDCLENDQHIQPHRKIANVVQVALHFEARRVGVILVTGMHLSPARNAWPDNVPARIQRNFRLKLLGKLWLFRTRPDKAHVPP